MAFPAYANSGTLVAETDTSIDIPFPSSISANDLLIMQVMTRDNVDINTPSGWTQDGTNGARDQTVNHRQEWFWLRASGSESGSVTVTRASGTTLFMGIIHRFTGVITSGTPYDVSAQTGLGSNATWTPADLDPPDAQDRLMVVLASANNDLLTATDYTGGTSTVTERVDVETTVGSDGTFHVADAQHSGSGAFDFGSQTVAAAVSNIQFTIALLPAASGATLTPASIVHTRGGSTHTVSPQVVMGSIVHTRAMGGPVISPQIVMGSIVHSRAMGAILVSTGTAISPASIVHTRAMGSPVVNPQAIFGSIIHTRAMGSHRVSPQIIMGSIVHTRAMGLPTTDDGIPDVGGAFRDTEIHHHIRSRK